MVRPYKEPAPPLSYRRPRLRLVLANAHTILRRGVRMMLADEPDLEVIGEASSVSDAVALVRCLQPDVIISDVFENQAGIAAIRDMRRECAGARIVMLTHSTDKECERAALLAGARAYIVNDAPIEVLLNAIREESPESEGLHRDPHAPAVHKKSLLPAMTARELEVLIGVALGYSSKRIAGDLGRSVKTIEKHRFKMMHKLGLRNTAAVTRYAMDHGLLDAESGTGRDPALRREEPVKARQE